MGLQGDFYKWRLYFCFSYNPPPRGLEGTAKFEINILEIVEEVAPRIWNVLLASQDQVYAIAVRQEQHLDGFPTN
jgi:hypothetical protein